MGMPVITPGDRTGEQAITDLIESIAMQERALSHILNAESEKMQTVINMEGVTAQQLLQLNRSVEQMVNTATRLETILQTKLELVDMIDATCFDEVGWMAMATISGSVIFDRDRSLSISSQDSGIAGIPVVLQNTVSGMRLVVLTDTNGNYSFINVADGSYRIVEAYGETGGVTSPGDFANAVVGNIPEGVNPPVSAVSNPPTGTTNIDSLTPDTTFCYSSW